MPTPVSIKTLSHFPAPTSLLLPAQAPPTPNHAPPQMYMMFLLKGYTYSSAQWVTLTL